MLISIIICTRNRADSLRGTLESLARVDVPRGISVETLVVDNGSSDETAVVVANAILPWGEVRLEVEPKVGVSNARNRALSEASGEIFLWTDDDVRMPSGWIEGMVRPILYEGADAVAGGVRLGEGRERHWMGKCHRTWLASSESLDASEPGRLIGANMAFHRRVLEGGLRFDPALGPGALGMGEETLFSYEMLAAGYRLVGALDVVVEHLFDPARLNRKGMDRIASAMGRSEAYIEHHWHRAIGGNARLRVWDAQLRWASWVVRGWFYFGVPNGLLERRLQALARVAYWRYLAVLRKTKNAPLDQRSAFEGGYLRSSGTV